jgi:hypothetical protein
VGGGAEDPARRHRTRFARAEPRRRALAYLHGLLGNVRSNAVVVPGSLVPHLSSSGSGPVAQLGVNAHGEVLEPGRVPDCYLGLLLDPPGDQDAGRVLVVAPASLLYPAVPQPGGTLLYELVTGHPDRAPHELVTEGLAHEVVAQQQRGVAEGLRPTSSASSPSQERIRSPSTPNRKGRRRSGGRSWCMPATTPLRRDRLHSRGGEGRHRVWTP